jgi:subtilisin
VTGTETVFDDIFRLLTPERLLHDPRATGEGVSVALIDSGVERSVLEAKFGSAVHPIEGAVFRPDIPQPQPYTGHQSSPHGTTVADIVLTLAPRAKIYSADVFGPTGTCEVDTVIRALQHATDVWKCKIVNLSLGVPESKLQQLPKRQQFLKAIEDGYYKDVLIFAAAHNEHPLTRS